MRLIDADALETHEQIESMGNGMYEYVQVVYKDDIDDAPTIEPEHNADDERKIADLHKMVNYLLDQLSQRWIPVTERLPKIGKEVLLSEPNAMFIAEYHGSGDSEGLWLVDGRHHYLADVNGCAWMPRPKPYKEDEQDG